MNEAKIVNAAQLTDRRIDFDVVINGVVHAVAILVSKEGDTITVLSNTLYLFTVKKEQFGVLEG